MSVVIIPAYKPRFLQETLDSIAKQNNHEFTVYIGDDASPYPLETIVDRYKNKFDIIYHRFEQNMGKKDLPGHWERCILLSAEELIWLFSDDDLMPFDGVARIIRASQKHSEGKYIFRFPLEVVDEYGKLKYKNPPFKTDLTSGYEFLLDKLSGKISSAACEYVFSRTVWEQTGGFIKFPLGVYATNDTFSIVNDGDETGFTLRIEALPSDIPQEVVAVTPTIYNEKGEYLQIKGDILTGDVITVTTKTGNKTVTLTRNGVDSNILNRLVSGSTWLTLKEGTNIFRVEAVRGVKKLRVTLIHRNSYLGV